jgi:tight adherence protein B
VPLFLLENFLLAAAGLVIGCLIPLGWWGFCRMRRFSKMRKHLPETLELMADSLQSGRNLEQALELVARQAPAPLGVEFGYAASQLRLGHAPIAVIDRMQYRVPVQEFHAFATALLVHRKTGGNLAVLATRLAQSARDRFEFQGHLRAVSAGSRLSALGLLAGSIAAVAILSWLEPEYLDVFLTHKWGMPLLAIAGVLQIVGLAWVWRILRVQF